MKIEFFGLLFVNSYLSLSLTFYRDAGYNNVLGSVDVNVGQCAYVGDSVNDKASSARWSDSANLTAVFVSMRTILALEELDAGMREVAVSLYNYVPNLPCYARNSY
ncbi:hypothetical protein CONCODRAFT_12421 [Conidiobolus coronatus NRRL 28638]|uniref:Uncharacterized protein n=1 Tax=Conidiobolus coronatus (strain ATCC 28846 / CBS 209.66 / NRRL 28638) TaxID=796925 RepID=A0A137NT43_CONC2|nr:hypothetical protein CONCODRAFT_12421 [Conidiobolus coronatus NRRL 28638]|eukprot:KXN65879.1 hypothetical protein CONCODRAFT_12421 [Conidiobolus coronatus NRRL 28638]